ncbi:glycogen synthase GlgA [bacterium]|nr:glycogen synthase GlgA [candidate division CSSED10-310 bacterium]
MKSKNTILLAASEASPFAKTGGLADAVSALAGSLKQLDYNPSIIIPRYRSVGLKYPQHCLKKNIQVPLSDRMESADLFRTELNAGIPVFLIDKPKYYDRDDLYRTKDGDHKDNAERFIFFSRAIIQALPYLPDPIDIVHCNDWQTALVPLYIDFLKSQRPDLQTIKTVFTIHNIAFQGLFWRFDMHFTGLPWSYFTPDALEYYGDMNLMKAGIIFADRITTVSEQYCREIQTPEFGCGLDGLLRKYGDKLSGILNGIDTTVWNPESDPDLARNYSINDLQGKQACKKDLLKKCKLNLDREDLLIGMITRLTSQKGLDLLSQALPALMEMPVGLILLGKGERHYEETFQDFSGRYSGRFAFINRFDESLAHLIEAGSDVFLMPSRYEPCGLNQLYSLRYGTVPVVRSTGGLHDTIVDVTRYPESGSGFKFKKYSALEMLQAVRKVLEIYADREKWRRIMKNGMAKDFSWEMSARHYDILYRLLLQELTG